MPEALDRLLLKILLSFEGSTTRFLRLKYLARIPTTATLAVTDSTITCWTKITKLQHLIEK